MEAIRGDWSQNVETAVLSVFIALVFALVFMIMELRVTYKRERMYRERSEQYQQRHDSMLESKESLEKDYDRVRRLLRHQDQQELMAMESDAPTAPTVSDAPVRYRARVRPSFIPTKQVDE